MWKFKNFSATQILREISFGDSGSAKTTIFAILEALNLANLVNFSIQKSAKYHNDQNSELPNVLKWQTLHF